jgi:CDP-6-deoxy-D-xylo-4-hexulose-3-dehydrase
MGEGGCVLTARPDLKVLVESFRDWGRDCWCDPGCDNTCGKRFDWQLGQLPHGYDHKYTYSHVGYNLKTTDLQAALGSSQIDKLPAFIQQRRANFQRLRAALEPARHMLYLPDAAPHAEPTWFGFLLGVRPEAPFTRTQLIAHLEANKIATRLLFGGNLLRQPAFRDTPRRLMGELTVADAIMHRTFWVGVYPGLTEPMLDFIAATLAEAFGAR